MRAINTIKSAASLAAVAVLLAACNSTPVKTADTAAQPQQPQAKPDVKNGRDVTQVVAKDELNDPNSPLAKRSVYFDFDQYVVKPEYSTTVNAHSKYLGANKGKKILIQGNTDERGGSEYNLALGQKRAEAVRKSLSLLGVPESQMEAVSLGKEKPKATGSNEAAWAENRRADIIYSGKYCLKRGELCFPCMTKNLFTICSERASAGRRAAQKAECTVVHEHFEQHMSPDHARAVRS